MEIQEKVELNKKIRDYNGQNSFVLSLQKHLKNSKYLDRVEYKNRTIKVLSENQYNAVSGII